MIKYTVHWYDVESGVTISKEIVMDQYMLEDIALEQIPKSAIRTMLNDIVPYIEIK